MIRPLARAGGCLLVLVGCGGQSDPTPSVTPGPSAAAAGCAQLLDRLPGAVLGGPRDQPPATGTAAWAGTVLRCGVTPPPPTTDDCIETDGVDWVFTESAASYTFTTYGREPAVEVTVPTRVERVRAAAVMVELAAAVSPIPQLRSCL